MPYKAPQHKPNRLKPKEAPRSAETLKRELFYDRAAWLKFRKWFLSDPANVVCNECQHAEATEDGGSADERLR
jgi:hypothetical protein